MHRNERFLTLTQIDKVYHALRSSEFCLKSMRIGLFTIRKTHA